MKDSLLIFLFILMPLIQKAENKEKLFKQANQYYKEAKYEKSIESYKKILDMGFYSSDIYYNLGNCYFKINKIASAILNYEKALKINPNDKEIKFNLKIANSKTIDKITPLPKGFEDYFYYILSSKRYAYLSIIFSFLSVILFIFRKKYKLANNLSIACLLAFIVCFILAYNTTYNQKTKTFAILMTSNSYVKSEPNEYSDDILSIHAGIKLEILDQVQGWNKIRLEDGKIGWLAESDMEKI